MCQDERVAARKRLTQRREEPLSRDRIVEAAVMLLDSAGEEGLTFRALAERLQTGAGAIYWHVDGKDELLAIATDALVDATLAAAAPDDGIRAIAAGLFDAMDAHPWLGAQLARAPWKDSTLRVFERIGRVLQSTSISPPTQFTAASALVSYIVGVGSQNAANASRFPGTDREDFLDAAAAEWDALDPAEYTFTRSVAGALRAHDDRAEFLAGIDLFLAGIGRGSPSR